MCYESLSLNSRRQDFRMNERRKCQGPEQIVARHRDAEVMSNAGKDLAPELLTLEVLDATYHRCRNQLRGIKSKDANRWSHPSHDTVPAVLEITSR
jgi:hypothetical protein